VLRALAEELSRVLAGIEHPVTDVLDLFAATQPYRDMLPAHETYVSMDIDEHYGPQDVVSDEFLPFADETFDLILFTEAFHYVTEPEEGVAELRRVLRPGGTLSAAIQGRVWPSCSRAGTMRGLERSAATRPPGPP
jgi:SAM-dependent methyltransferase